MDKAQKTFVNKTNAKRPPGSGAYTSVIAQISKNNVCPFCPDQLNTYHKKPIIKNGKFWLATENMYPYHGAKEHLLLIHKEHIESLSELDSVQWGELKQILDALIDERNIPGAALIMRSGQTAYTGATVNHLHAQLVSGSGDPDAEPILTRLG